MKRKKDPRDVVYNYDGVNYVGSYDSKGNFHPPCRPPERPPKSDCSCKWADETSVEPTRDQDIVNWLRSENAYLRGQIEVYEKFLKDIGYIKEEE